MCIEHPALYIPPSVLIHFTQLSSAGLDTSHLPSAFLMLCWPFFILFDTVYPPSPPTFKTPLLACVLLYWSRHFLLPGGTAQPGLVLLYCNLYSPITIYIPLFHRALTIWHLSSPGNAALFPLSIPYCLSITILIGSTLTSQYTMR